MHSALVAIIASVALATGVSAVMPFASSSCQDMGASITMAYDLTQNCIKAKIDSEDSGGGSRTVTVTIDFPADAIDNSLIEANSMTGTQWAVHVYDPEQGRVIDNQYSFSTSPAIGAEAMAKTTLGAATVRAYTDQDEISTTSTQAVYYTTLDDPRGRWELTFSTSPVGANPKPLEFAVSIVKLSVEDGNFATNTKYPMSFTFGKDAAGGSVPLSMLAPNANTAYLQFVGYSPASDGRLVSDLQVGMTATGARVTSATVSAPDTGVSASGAVVRTGAGSYLRVALPPAAVPRTPSGAIPGNLRLQMTVNYAYIGGSTSDYRTVDLKANGPFVPLKAGSTSDTFTEALPLSPGGSAEIPFDLNTVSTDDGTARLPVRILKLQMPDRWWALRLTGSVTLKDDSDKVVALVGGNGLSSAGAFTPSGSAFGGGAPSTSLVADPSRAGGFVVFNDGVSTIDTTQFMPIDYSKVANGAWLSGSGASAFGGPSQSLNWPYYDSRLASSKPMYVVLCASTGCGLGAVTSSLPQLRTATVTWAKTETFGGECTSNVACVTQTGGKYPAADRASLSANGNAQNFDTCVLFADSTARNLETRCVECTSDCHCAPDQYCYRYTGINPATPAVVDEQSRLLAGTCQRRDPNNTQIGKRCMHNAPSLPLVPGGIDYSFASQPYYVEGQDGPVPCSDVRYIPAGYVIKTGVQFNYTGLASLQTWQGFCDDENICRTCRSSWAGANPITACSGGRVCVNNEAIYSMSMDGTPATVTADVRASVLVALLFFFLVTLLVIAVMAIISRCCGGGKADKTDGSSSDTAGSATRTTNPAAAHAAPAVSAPNPAAAPTEAKGWE